MSLRHKPRMAGAAAAILAGGTVLAMTTGAGTAAAASPASPLVNKQVRHVIVIDLENESFGATFGGTAMPYLSTALLPRGEVLKNYYATGHVSQDNYIAQISGQAPNNSTSSDCIGTGGNGSFNDLLPGTSTVFPGQVVGDGCVFPSTVKTIGDQLTAANPHQQPERVWREYAEDMGNDPARDGGVPDPLGGTDCAHPAQTGGIGVDLTNNATTSDQYANRHNPFVYFHSVIDDPASCATHVVPLGTVTVGQSGERDTYQGHLAQDLKSDATTPQFAFITPNLCNDGHDDPCVGPNTEGSTYAAGRNAGKPIGGLQAADMWLKHWMPLILNSPAYKNGSTLVVVTFDEGSIADTSAGDNEQAGPNSDNPGYSAILNFPIPQYGNRTYYQLLGVNGLTPGVRPDPGTMPGGGQIGALLLNPRWVNAGAVVDGPQSYNHYSALRTYEDLLGVTTGGADGKGHLGFAATATTFGSDVFRSTPAPQGK